LWLLIVVDARRTERGSAEHARRRNMKGARVAGVRQYPTRFGRVGEMISKGVLAVLFAQVSSPPHAGSNPDTDNTNYHDDKKNNPLIMRVEPETSQGS